ncbi:unnamed protein product [Adineta steineri]|uniref:Uncharacterized protein n=1 Tax=Adineta steineri TaxID=433720 RepID=A0A814ZYW2_9BILA|nr:unnamed protein product [Adineta steineri]CAF3623254.1 unnamed protein product [Adineta steineri]
MTYCERDSVVSRSPQHQQPYLQKRTVNNTNNHWLSSRLSPSQSVRIECKAEEQYFIGDTPSYRIHSSLNPIHLTMNDQYKPIQFRSQIILHNDPQTDVRIDKFSVAFHCPDDPSTNTISRHHRSTPATRSQSLHASKSSLPQRHQLKDNDSRRKLEHSSSSSSLRSQALLHQWIDDICANTQLMSNDDIVFFIKNGEFFARI